VAAASQFTAREMLTVNGRRVHVVWRAPKSGEDSLPTFIIEAACGWHSAMYAWLIEALAAHGRVIAYDRSGLGRSDPGRAAPDANARAQELHALIGALSIAAPLILVGHSIAGLYLRVYACRHADRVGALVLLDPTHHQVHRFSGTRIPVGERAQNCIALAAHRLGLRRLPFPLLRGDAAPWNSLPTWARNDIESLSTQPLLRITEQAERAMLAAACMQAQSCGDLQAIPLLVITGGTRSDEERRYIRDLNGFMARWMAWQRELAALSIRSSHRVIAGAGHRNLVTDGIHAAEVCTEIVRFVREHVPTRSGSD
jgi:pimeloyl-ACP methyl ester carboxylesterase